MNDETNEVVEKAQKMGWVPEDEWKGDPEKWRPAKEFVERGENIIPILKDQLNKTKEELEALIKNNQAEIAEVKRLATEQAKKEYEKKLEALKEEQFKAIQESDGEKFKKIDKEINDLKKPEETTTTVNPVFVDWHKKNPWYQTDREMSDYAEFIGARLKRDNPSLPAADFYASIEKQVKSVFPGKFENKNRSGEDQVEGGTGKPTTNKKMTFADLPESARATYNRLAKKFEVQGKKFTKEQYLKTYIEE